MEETRDALLKTGQYFSSPGPVPTVDPADLQNVWELMEKVGDLAQRAHVSLPKAETEAIARSGNGIAYDLRSLGLPVPANAGYSPGADVGAVSYRVQMLGMLADLAKIKQMGERLKQGQTSLSDTANLPDLDYCHVDLREFTRLISG